jgi:hypothetical protein
MTARGYELDEGLRTLKERLRKLELAVARNRPATGSNFDNTGSGSSSDNTQDALDELFALIAAGEPFATPAIVLGEAAAAGVATTVIRSDATVAAFDATVPVTQAFSDAAATGSVAFAARRDHRHGMPAASGVGAILITDTPAGTPLVFADLLQNEEGTDLLYADP